MNTPLPRRQFLRRSATLATGLAVAGPGLLRSRAATNGKLNVGFIGVAHRAAENLAEIARLAEAVNVAALCDVDDNYLAEARARHPTARTYNDFRQLIDQKDLDAIVVSTPDHTHAVAAAAALRTGRPVYCEKPLTRTVSECRALRELAAQVGRPTQLGTQIHAGGNYRRVVELIQSGAIGAVKEAHVWCGASYGGKERPAARVPVPAGLHWDLWLGPVPERAYSPEYAPFSWRNWWAFSGGALGDFGCHFMDLPHWALDLRLPEWVEPVDGPPVHAESVPPWLVVRYRYPARSRGGQTLPPVTLTWYHGGKQPEAPLLDAEQREYFKSGALFVGEKGNLLADYGRRQLLPEERFKGFQPPAPTIPDSIGHHKEWIEAIRNGGPTTCNFDYSGALTEAVLLGNVAYRTGRRIEWDGATGQARGVPEAAQFVQHTYRPGWQL
jgi:predicted dehydrogenase